MMIQSAVDFNLDLKFLDPDPNAPCSKLNTEFQQGSLKDFDTVYTFGKDCDLVTIEIENVNTEALKKLEEEGVRVFPQPHLIELIQDKRIQKQFYHDNGIPTSPFILVNSREDLKNHLDRLPAVNKLGKEGYDGRGVQVIKSSGDIEKGFDAPGLLEDFVDFEKEISVIVGRNESGEIRHFPVVELVFHPEANLVEYLFSPAEIDESYSREAYQIAESVITRLGLVGLLAVEMFLTKDGKILVNEIAPRTHNSGHQTIEGNITSQFEQHIRAILNMPLGSTKTIMPAAMLNILGSESHTGDAIYEGLQEVLHLEGVHVHLYGKKITKPFRKMGHVTVTGQSGDELKEKIEKVRSNLKVIA